MEPVIPALHAFRRGVGDVLPALRPAHLVAFALHQGDEFLAGFGVPHALVGGVHQPELPALSFGGGAVLTGAHPFLLGLLFRRRQDLQTVGGTDSITGQPVVLEIGGALVEFPAVLKADAVDDQVAVQVSVSMWVATSTSKLGNSRWASSRAMAWASWGVRSSVSAKDWTKW